MKSALRDLFDLLDDGERTQEYDAACQKTEPWLEKLASLGISSEEQEEILTAAMRIGESECHLWFERGFCWGMRLMEEALTQGKRKSGMLVHHAAPDERT